MQQIMFISESTTFISDSGDPERKNINLADGGAYMYYNAEQ